MIGFERPASSVMVFENLEEVLEELGRSRGQFEGLGEIGGVGLSGNCCLLYF